MQGERQIEDLFFWHKSQVEVDYRRNKSITRSSLNKAGSSYSVARTFSHVTVGFARDHLDKVFKYRPKAKIEEGIGNTKAVFVKIHLFGKFHRQF